MRWDLTCSGTTAAPHNSSASYGTYPPPRARLPTPAEAPAMWEDPPGEVRVAPVTVWLPAGATCVLSKTDMLGEGWRGNTWKVW